MATGTVPAERTEGRKSLSTGRRRYFIPLLVIAFTLVVVAGTAAVYMAFRSMEADALVTQSYRIRQVATRLLSYMQDAETGERGFLLTQDPAYLAPFDDSKSNLESIFGLLRDYTATSPEQSSRVAALRPIIDSKMALSQHTIDLARNGQADAARQSVVNGEGKRVMDDIRSAIQQINDSERDMLLARQARAAGARSWLLGLVIASLLGAVALAGVLGRAAQRALVEARQHAYDLEAEVLLRRETQETLRQAQKIEAVGQLTGGIAHDFNNLLTVILGNLDTLRRRLSDAPKSEDTATFSAGLVKTVELAIQGARSAAQLTHRLLAFSRRQPLAPSRVDLNRLISDMSDLLRRTIGETVNIETVLAGGLWPTFIDSNQVENALLNLCINARDAMPNGGKLTIETANTALDEAYARQFGDVTPGQYAMLSVTDVGTGMSEEALSRAFEPFFTTKATGQGSGLGLAMVHGFVKQSGGHVRIYSELGQGTTVKMYLPRLLQDEIAAAPPVRTAPSNTRIDGSETILLVEDNDNVREFAKSALAELGYTVLEAIDAARGLEIIEGDGKIDLLFTDVVLPGMSGRDLANRATAKRPDLPVLFTTGYTRNAIIHHGRLDPGVQLLTKPFTQQDLARKIREVLDGKSAGAA